MNINILIFFQTNIKYLYCDSSSSPLEDIIRFGPLRIVISLTVLKRIRQGEVFIPLKGIFHFFFQPIFDITVVRANSTGCPHDQCPLTGRILPTRLPLTTRMINALPQDGSIVQVGFVLWEGVYHAGSQQSVDHAVGDENEAFFIRLWKPPPNDVF